MAKDSMKNKESTETKDKGTKEILKKEKVAPDELSRDKKDLKSPKDKKQDSKPKDSKISDKKTKIVEKKVLPKTLDFDLNALFKDEESLESFAKELDKKLQTFNDSYAGKLSTLKAEEFSKALQTYDSFSEGLGSIMTYVFLKFAIDSKKYGALYADYEMKCNAMYAKVMFFELEFADLDSTKMNEFIKANEKYAFFLQTIEANKK